MEEELWQIIPEFPNYSISTRGRVYNRKRDSYMRTSFNEFGHMKITLLSQDQEERFTRSVAHLVAEAFVEPPNERCDCVVLLDGDLSNVNVENLVWRPRWLAWKYSRQLKAVQPVHYHNLNVINVVTGVEYKSIIEAGTTEGLLFDDIWRSTYTGIYLFPHQVSFEITNRV